MTDSAIRDAVTSGVTSMRELRRETGCSGTCGRCAETAKSVLDQALAQTPVPSEFELPVLPASV